MIRAALAALGFVVATGMLVWVLAFAPESTGPESDLHVTRNQAADAILIPAETAAAPHAPSLAAPQARPEPVGRIAPVQAASPARQPVPDTANDPVTNVVRQMSLGIVQELRKPVAPGSVPRPATAAPAAAAAPLETYTVQPGDSLAGIAFRFFGTTAAYPSILDANSDILPNPAALREGMVLRIPRT